MKQAPRQGPYLQGNNLSWLTQSGHPEAETQTFNGSLDGVADLKAATSKWGWGSGEEEEGISRSHKGSKACGRLLGRLRGPMRGKKTV